MVIGEDEGDPDAWEVHLRIYLKEFDPNLLQSSYTKIKNSLISVIWSYKKALDQVAMFSSVPSEPFSGSGRRCWIGWRFPREMGTTRTAPAIS